MESSVSACSFPSVSRRTASTSSSKSSAPWKSPADSWSVTARLFATNNRSASCFGLTRVSISGCLIAEMSVEKQIDLESPLLAVCKRAPSERVPCQPQKRLSILRISRIRRETFALSQRHISKTHFPFGKCGRVMKDRHVLSAE